VFFSQDRIIVSVNKLAVMKTFKEKKNKEIVNGARRMCNGTAVLSAR
jgi:hypothetical protein